MKRAISLFVILLALSTESQAEVYFKSGYDLQLLCINRNVSSITRQEASNYISGVYDAYNFMENYRNKYSKNH